MRFRTFICSMLLLVMILIVSGCNSTNEAYETAIENGIASIEKEKYVDAVRSFEIARAEEQEDKQAVSYMTQAQLLLDARVAKDSKKYDEALTYIEKVNKTNEPLDIVKDKAKKLEDEINKVKKELAYQKELDNIRSLIGEQDYERAESKLSTLKNLLDSDTTLDEQLAEVSASIDAGKKEAEEKKKEEQKKEEEGTTNSNQSGYLTYSNERFGYSVKYPSNFAVSKEPENMSGRSFTDGECTISVYGANMNTVQENETIETYYNQVAEAIGGLSGTYHTINENSYVISYVECETIVYQKAIAQDECITTLTFEYPASEASKYDQLVNEISKSLTGGHLG